MLWIAVEFIPDQYASTARVSIDTESMLGSLMKGIAAEINTDDLTRVEIIRRSILGRANLEKVMRMTDLDITVTTPVETERLLASLRSRLTVEREGRERDLFSISFIDRNPRAAQEIVQALLSIFVEGNLGESREDIARTQRFLEGEIAEIEREIDQAETKLSRFRMVNRDLLPREGNAEDQLREAVSELGELRDRQAEEIRVRDQLTLELARLTDITPGLAELSPQAARVAELETELIVLLSKFKETYPGVVAHKRLLEAERAALAASAAQDGGTPVAPDDPNSRRGLLRAQLSEHNSRISEIGRRIASLESQIEELRRSTENLPAIQAEYTQLERELEVLRENHVGLLERRGQAHYAEAIDTKSEAVQFRIIEPPNLPIKSLTPDPRILRAAGLFGGLASGIGMAILLSLVLPTFGTARELERFCRRPVIGKITVSPSPTERWQRRAGNSAFAVLSLALFVAAGLAVSNFPGRVVSLLANRLAG
jgi:polysaccharide chain length determinant protein (PEP-CTERM system associated)